MTISKRSAKRPSFAAASGLPAANHQLSTFNHQPSRRGIALVITLILLSVTLVMAVAFLALSRRDRNAVATVTDTAMARLAADSALAAAQAQIAANIFTTNTAAYNFKLLVSTNFINGNGFDTSALAYANLTNVSYVYPNGNPLNANDLIQNSANLLFLPRAPVFVSTNQTPYGYDFRYYLDLNRNSRYETNGNVQEFDSLNNAIGNPFLHVGDPEWIGVLERPDQPHGPNNQFIARYAFLAQPIGNGLDLNHLHNQSVTPNLNSAQDGYFRNEGVGSWELNLAAFLADLNTNVWNTVAAPYFYGRPQGNFNTGNAFFDAFSLLNWRYDSSYNTLAIPPAYFYNGLVYAGVDGYTVGTLMTNTFLPLVNLPINTHWAGSDNTNHFFALPSDLFDAAKSSVFFTNRLQSAGTNTATYDRYTFYRMLDQLGTDSSADDGKMNLNYNNLDPYIYTVGANTFTNPPSETNLMAWTPLGFFTNAADRMLRYYTSQWHDHSFGDFTNTFGTVTTNAFSVTNIPVYVEGRFVYTPAVNRILQLAANLYDASTNKALLPGSIKDFPSVFRPVFSRVTTNGYDNIYITGFTEVSALNSFAVGSPPLDQPKDITDTSLIMNAQVTAAGGNAYGVPWIIGAKKGFPGFNQFYSRNMMQVTRKLQVTRLTVGGAIETNQMFIMAITNRIGFSFWNSYNTNYVPASGSITVYFKDYVGMGFTNALGNPPFNSSPYGNSASVSFGFTNSYSYWPGSFWNDPNKSPDLTLKPADTGSFIHGFWDFAFLPQSQYKYGGTPTGTGSFISSSATVWETGTGFVPILPQFGLATTNRVQGYVLDGNHVIDYVQFAGPDSSRNMNSEINDLTFTSTSYWSTNFYGGTPYSGSGPNPPTWGVVKQIDTGRNPPLDKSWKRPSNLPAFITSQTLEGQYFDAFFFPDSQILVGSGKNATYKSNTNLSEQVPYTPTIYAWDLTLWQANDPLVHHLAGDLNTTTANTGQHRGKDLTSTFPESDQQLNSVTDRYQPWGRYNQMGSVTGVDKAGAYNLRLHDPLVWGSDYWNFPSGKLPNVGWIGRVHRGTPWQTVYLKQRNVLDEDPINHIGTNTWGYWTGDTQWSFINGRYWDAANTAPIRDSDLFDLFTTRFNDNAAHGALSVNQTHLAAWSAVLSGVVALTNTTENPNSWTTPAITNFIGSPAGVGGLDASAIGNIVTNINDIRSTFTNADGVVGAFEHTGDILRVPALTERSPFLNLDASTSPWSQINAGISDEVYEWLPQQIMGLLRVSATPRYVVYCYGQALRPASGSQVLSAAIPNTFGMVTNYQVVAESAARAVLRVDRILVTNLLAVPPVSTNYTTTVESYNPLPPD